MEKEQETAQELDLDQMEKVSGGYEDTVLACPWCERTFDNLLVKRFHDHVRNCPDRPVEPTALP